MLLGDWFVHTHKAVLIVRKSYISSKAADHTQFRNYGPAYA